MANPQLHNLYEAFYAMYSAIGVKEIDKILPPPPQPTPLDPAVENIMALSSVNLFKLLKVRITKRTLLRI